MKLRPKRRMVTLPLGGAILLLVATNAQAGWLYVVSAAMFGIAIAGALIPAFHLRGLRFERVLPQTATVGDALRVKLRVVAGRGWSRGPLFGRDLLTGSEVVVDRVSSRSQHWIHCDFVPQRRGWFSGGQVEMTTGAPFGVLEATRRWDVSSELLVHPRWVQVGNLPLLESASAPDEDMHDRSRRGEGLEVFGLRDYRRGDSIRHIHWRSSARGGGLLVREYEQPPSSRLVIFIDSHEDIGTGTDSTFEVSISVAASIAMYGLDVGHPIEMVCDAAPERRLVEPGKMAALDWLAKLDGRKGRALSDLVMSAELHTLRRSTAVLIFPLTAATGRDVGSAVSALQEAGARVLAIAVSPRAGSADRTSLGANDVADLLTRLRQGRAIVYRIDPSRELTECLREPLHV